MHYINRTILHTADYFNQYQYIGFCKLIICFVYKLVYDNIIIVKPLLTVAVKYMQWSEK